MKRRVAVVVVTLLLFSFLIYASLQSGIHLLHSHFFQLDSKLIYVIVSSFALGALVLFLLVSILPMRKSALLHRFVPIVAAPEHPSSRILEAETAITLGECERGEELLTGILPADSDYWYARKLIGDLELRKGNEAVAEQRYQESLRATAGWQRAFVFLSLANLWEHQDKIDPAKDLYKEILRLIPSATEAVRHLRSLAIREQDWREALSWQEHLEQCSPKVMATEEEAEIKIGIRYELAQSEYEAGNYQTAQALLKFVLRLTDSFTPAYLLSGEIQNRFENPSAALKTWERGLENTQNPVLLRRIGEFYLSRNLPEKAIEFFRNIILQHPEDSLFEFCLGDLYLKIEMIQEARKVFEKIEERSPGWILNQAVLGEIYEKTGKHEEAAKAFRKILDSAEVQAVLPWQCYYCNTTYPAYRSFCFECFEWDSLSLNQNKAGNMDFRYVESTASPP